MVLSIILNLIVGFKLKSELSQKNYLLNLEIEYRSPGIVELLYDTGSNFNQAQRESAKVNEGKNSLQIPFQLKYGNQLKFIRLDFGQDTMLTRVKINKLVLLRDTKQLFKLSNREIADKTIFLHGVEKLGNGDYSFKLDNQKKPFDPYIVFRPLNELVYSLPLRTFLLTVPWLILLFPPIFSWIKLKLKRKEFELILVGMFLASLLLKIAWVTFTTLLLLGYAVFIYFKNRKLHFGPNHFLVMLLFGVPLFFLGDGQFAKLSIPLGFLLFPIICSIIDFTRFSSEIKGMYVKVFMVVMSIIVVSAALLFFGEGYFYNIDWTNYFSNIRYNRHLLLNMFYYDHTTFISFFILIGEIFVIQQSKKNVKDENYIISYSVFALITLILLGSRFALCLGALILILSAFSVQILKKYLIPLWSAALLTIFYFIDFIDPFRARLWRISWNKSRDSIWFGHGTGNSSALLPESLPIKKIGFESTIMEVNHSHNQYLAYVLENGLLGAAIATTVLILIFYQYAKHNNKAMLLIIFACLMLMIIESPFRTSTPLYLISFLLSIFPLKSALQSNQNTY